jgi:enamine deaminase RidA (YjgF/YER057c/UK114 family)
MPVELIRHPPGLCEPLGRYSQLSIGRGTEIICVAGQVGVTADGELAGDGVDVRAQTRQIFENIATALQAVGLGLREIAKMTTFIVGADNLPGFQAERVLLFQELFPDGEYPPNTIVIVSRLAEERFAIEIEAMAIR